MQGIIDIVVTHQDRFLTGAWTTVRISVLAFLLAFLLGNLVASLRVSPVPVLQRAAMVYVSIFRNLPLAVLALLFWIGGGRAGWPFGRVTTVVLVLGAYTGAYIAEALRSGINAVPPGQAEAARAIGLPFTGVVGQVVLPQAIRTVIPPLGNLWISNLKNSSVFYIIGFDELTRAGRDVGQAETNYVASFIIVGAIYLLLVYGSAQVIKLIERRLEIAR